MKLLFSKYSLGDRVFNLSIFIATVENDNDVLATLSEFRQASKQLWLFYFQPHFPHQFILHLKELSFWCQWLKICNSMIFHCYISSNPTPLLIVHIPAITAHGSISCQFLRVLWGRKGCDINSRHESWFLVTPLLNFKKCAVFFTERHTRMQ